MIAESPGMERPRATPAGLLDCVHHVRMRFGEGAEGAGDLLDDEGQVIQGEVDIAAECKVSEAAERRAKCSTQEAFGRVLHADP